MLPRELLAQIDQLIIGNFVPVFGFTPQLPELIEFLRMVEIEILVNGTPCAVQSSYNPPVGLI